ncbi:MAG: DUF1698 domain-containing protein [bacterium]|nr:DUF1698 domain-containing protein [bacterium]
MRYLRKIIVKAKSQLVKLKLRSKEDVVSLDPPKSGMSKEAVIEKIAQVPFWWHHIDLGYGITTPGHQGDIHHPTGSKNLLENLQIPQNLKGKTVLDIGAWDGFLSFAAERRGADKVMAIDNFYRDQLEHTASRGFEIAKEILASKVEFRKASVYDLNPEEFGMFDVVIFPGVFYHLRHPLMALDKVYSVCREMLILETHYDPYDGDSKTPLARFYEGSEVNNDPTTWWGFNEACLLASLRSVGFKNPEVIYKYADRIIVKAYKS